MAGGKQSDLKIYSRLLSYVVPYWAAFLLSIVGFLLYSIANVSFVQLVSYIVDSLGGASQGTNAAISARFAEIFGDPGQLNRTLIPVAIIVIASTRGAGTFIGNYFISYVSYNLVHNLRREMFERLLKLPSVFYDRHAMGHLVAKVTFHVTQVTGAATDAVRVIIREGFTVIGYMGFLLYLNWRLTLVFLAVAPIIALLVSYAGKRFRRISERIQNSMGDVTHVASEAVQGYREVRTFGGTQYERDRFEKVSQDNRRQSMKMVVTSSIATPVIQIIVSVALASLVWLVLDPVFLANMSAGDVVAFITTGGLLAKPIRQLSEVNATVQKGLAAAEDIFDLFDEAVEEDPGTLELTEVKGRVEFRDVTFSYAENSRPVLRGISFTVEPGETVALVGRSGSGKSTLVSLIPRFYTPGSGDILVDGHSIREFTLQNLRQHIAIVSQQVTLFNDTVMRNIGYGALQDASPGAVRKAAEKAYAWSFIQNLEDGLDTLVGDDGVLLSGGQRQRLAIARAFLKDAPILILDEATSALDTESERYIQAALEAVAKGRTTFIIAHRLSTVEKADRILVIDSGQVVEQGTHAELLARRGHYYQLHASEELALDDPAANDAVTTDELAEVTGSVARRSGASSLVNAWYNDASWVKVFSPFAYVYQFLAAQRRKWIAGNAQWKAPVPVIVVGNITVGGTGKSPLVVALVNYLKSLGLKPGVVSRGYGGQAESYPLEVSVTVPVEASGDEPLMIHNRTGCPVVVDPDRVSAIQALLEDHDCDVIVSDDGLQHYRMERDAEIAVIDGERGLGNGLCLPAGPLREPPSRLEQVDLIVINGVAEALALPENVPVLNMRIVPGRLINIVSGEIQPLERLSGETVHGVAGISHPERFFGTLRQLGASVITHEFPDHHAYVARDVEFGDALPVIVTEKDAVKLDPGSLDGNHYWYIEVNAVFDKSGMNELLQRAGIALPEPGAAENVEN